MCIVGLNDYGLRRYGSLTNFVHAIFFSRSIWVGIGSISVINDNLMNGVSTTCGPYVLVRWVDPSFVLLLLIADFVVRSLNFVAVLGVR